METAYSYSTNNTMSAHEYSHSPPVCRKLPAMPSGSAQGSAKVLSLNSPPEMSYEVEGTEVVRRTVRPAFGLGTHALMCREVHRK